VLARSCFFPKTHHQQLITPKNNGDGMSKSPLTPKRFRKNFGKIKQIVEIPDLIGMQRESFQRFLQMDVPPEKREEIGLQTVFKSVFPIKDFTGSASLEFVSYRFGEVKHSIEECVHR
jgi:DNA-directed RNA polymerase subunit beta